MQGKEYKLTISLVTWNGGKYLEHSLNSLLEQTFQDYFLMILDNGSVDETIKIIESKLNEFGDRVRLIKDKENLGFARAHNKIINWSDSDYLMILNQDIELEPDYLEKCIEFLNRHSQCGVVSGKILKWEVKNENGLIKTKKTNKIDSLGLKIFRSQKVIEQHVGEIDQGQFVEDLEVFGVSATVPIYRRKALESVKYEDQYFDEDFFSYKEDVDLAYRLRWQGWQAWVVCEAVAYHDRTAKATTKMSWQQKIRYRRTKSDFINYHSLKNHCYLLFKNLSLKHVFRYFFYIIIEEMKKFFFVLFFETVSLKGLGECFKNYQKMLKKRQYIMSYRKISDQEMAKWFC